MKIEKIKTSYQISDDGYLINVDILDTKNHNLTITPKGGPQKFEFVSSKPKVVKKMAELLLEAVKLQQDVVPLRKIKKWK